MTKNILKVQDAFRKATEKATAPPVQFPAVLGDSDGTVLTGTDGIVNVTFDNGQTVQVVNRRVPNKPFRKVIVGFDSDVPGKLQVLADRDVYASGGSDPLVPDHAKTHNYAGGDTVFASAPQIKPFLVLPYDGFEVFLFGGVGQKLDGTPVVVSNQIIDLSSYQPVSGALWALLEFDDDGNVAVSVSSTASSRELLTVDTIPAITNYALCAVILFATQTEVKRDPNTRNDFVDLRFGIQPRNATFLDGYPLDLTTLYPMDMSLLMYDASQNVWFPVEAAPDTDAVGGYPVIISSPADGEALVYDVHVNAFINEEVSGGGGGGGDGTAVFQRVLSADLTLADGECLVLTQYIDLATYDLELQGDADLEIL